MPHPHNLPRCLTATAFDGTPVTQFYAVLWLDEEYREGLIWAFDLGEAGKLAREHWPNGCISFQPVEGK